MLYRILTSDIGPSLYRNAAMLHVKKQYILNEWLLFIRLSHTIHCRQASRCAVK